MSLNPLCRWAATAALGTLVACGGGADEPSSPPSGDSTERAGELAVEVAVPRFEDVTAASGLEVSHATGAAGTYPMPAVMGGGVCSFDAEGDGDLDLFFVGGRPGAGGSEHQLFLQEEPWRFVDVSEGSGLAGSGWGMGCAVADVDLDGDADLFVTTEGSDALFLNETRDGSRPTFRDSSRAFGLVQGGWSASASFADFDRDGYPDLYVTRYVDFDPKRECAEGGRADFCGPARFDGLPDLLYMNRAGRSFEEVSASAGISLLRYRGLGVKVADFDDDGWLDLYVANDSDPNQLWRNAGDGTFTDEALFVGLAFNRFGVGEAGMGVALGDSDSDGDLDVFVSHLVEETNTLYENRGEAGFEDITSTSGLGLPSVGLTGFGTAFLDVDADGDLDLALANGAVKRRVEVLSERADWFFREYAEPNLLFVNDGAGHFVDVSARSGSFGEELEVSRGLLPVDLDEDGDLDLVLTNLEGPARLYRNDSENMGSWLSAKVLTAEGSPAVGAKVTVHAGDRSWVHVLSEPGGYLSGGEARLYVGLGSAQAVDSIEVRWPDGTRESFPGGATNRALVLRRGQAADSGASGGRQ